MKPASVTAAMRSLIVVVSTLVVLTACVTPQAQRAGTEAEGENPFAGMPAHASVLVAYPQTLDGFEFSSLHAAPEPENGTGMRYTSGTYPGMTLDAFAFLLGFSEEAQPVITGFEDSFAEYMQGAVDAGIFQAWTPRSHGRLSVTYPFGEREGAWRFFHVDLADTAVTLASVTHLHYRAPFAIRIRASHPPTIPEEEVIAHVADFATQFLPQLKMQLAQGCSEPMKVNLEDLDEKSATFEALNEALLDRGRRGCMDYDVARLIVDGVRKRAAAQESSP